jgi:prophage regulatory protein
MTAQTAAPTPLRLLRLPEVLVRVGLGRSAWYDLVRAGRAPQPCHLGERCVAWPEHEISEWVAARIAERPARETQAGR